RVELRGRPGMVDVAADHLDRLAGRNRQGRVPIAGLRIGARVLAEHPDVQGALVQAGAREVQDRHERGDDGDAHRRWSLLGCVVAQKAALSAAAPVLKLPGLRGAGFSNSRASDGFSIASDANSSMRRIPAAWT